MKKAGTHILFVAAFTTTSGLGCCQFIELDQNIEILRSSVHKKKSIQISSEKYQRNYYVYKIIFLNAKLLLSNFIFG